MRQANFLERQMMEMRNIINSLKIEWLNSGEEKRGELTASIEHMEEAILRARKANNMPK